MLSMREYLIGLSLIVGQAKIHAQSESECRLQPQYLMDLLKKLEAGENIVFTKFGDGEYLCMLGIPGHNCDGDTYTFWLKNALKKSLINLSKKENVYIGKWHTAQVCNYYKRIVKPYDITIPFVSYHLIMNDKDFLHVPYMYEFVKFVASTKRKKILFANKYNKRLKDLFKADIFIEIPENSWSLEYETWKTALEKHIEKDALILLAGGLCSKVLIHDITSAHDVSCIDIGSSFDILGGKRNSRGWQHSYEDEINYYYDLLPCCDENIVVEHVKQSIQNGNAGISKFPSQIMLDQGILNYILYHIVNNLCSLPYASYLEVGVEQGTALTSALFGNTYPMSAAVGIDNWTSLGRSSSRCMRSVTKLLLADAVSLYDCNSLALDIQQTFKIPINVYFYNADQEADIAYGAFTYFNDILADLCTVIVTNWDNPSVQTKAMQAYRTLGYQILFEKVLPARDTWKNDVYIAVIKKK